MIHPPRDRRSQAPRAPAAQAALRHRRRPRGARRVPRRRRARRRARARGPLPLHARRAGDDVPRPALDDAPVRGLRHGRRVEPPLQVPARAGRQGPLRRVRPAHADGPRLRPRDGARRGRPRGRRDRLARRHARPVRRHPARRGVHVDDDQRDRRDAARALHRRRRGARRGAERAARHDPERHPEGVHRARHVHLPDRGLDAPHHRYVHVLLAARAAVEHRVDQRLPHPRGGLRRRAGGRVHARRWRRVRRGGARRGPRCRRLRAAPLVLLQRAQQLHRGGREVPRRAHLVGGHHARPLRREEPEEPHAALPHADRGRDAAGAAAARERGTRDRAGARGGARRHAVAAHEQLRRGARPARCARSR
jgi:hypothetical protein